MLKYLLDTNIVIYTMKNRPQRVKRRFQQHHDQMGISTVTIGELVFGAEHSQQTERNLADIDLNPLFYGFGYHWLKGICG